MRSAIVCLVLVVLCCTSPKSLAQAGRKLTGGPVLDAGRDALSVAFSPDGKWIATGAQGGHDAGGNARVWEVATGKPITPPMTGPFGVGILQFRPDGKALLVGPGPRHGPGWMRVYDAATSKPITPFMKDVLDEASGSIGDATFSPDGKRVFGAFTDGARLYDALTG